MTSADPFDSLSATGEKRVPAGRASISISTKPCCRNSYESNAQHPATCCRTLRHARTCAIPRPEQEAGHEAEEGVLDWRSVTLPSELYEELMLAAADFYRQALAHPGLESHLETQVRGRLDFCTQWLKN